MLLNLVRNRRPVCPARAPAATSDSDPIPSRARLQPCLPKLLADWSDSSVNPFRERIPLRPGPPWWSARASAAWSDNRVRPSRSRLPSTWLRWRAATSDMLPKPERYRVPWCLPKALAAPSLSCSKPFKNSVPRWRPRLEIPGASRCWMPLRVRVPRCLARHAAPWLESSTSPFSRSHDSGLANRSAAEPRLQATWSVISRKPLRARSPR